MLKIIPTPENPVSLYTLPGIKWSEEMILINGGQGKYFEHWEDDYVRFQFFYILGKVTILKGEWTSDFSLTQMNAFFDSYVNFSDLWEWLDQIPFQVVKKLSSENSDIPSVWKMDYAYEPIGPGTEDLLENYFEFEVSTVTVRCIPYKWTYKIKFDVSDENNKLYWITLCLLKYQRQSKQQSEG